MSDSKTRDTDARYRSGPDGRSPGAGPDKTGDTISMHADVEVWEDCCSCEAEPYWVEAFAGQATSEGRDDTPSQKKSAADRGLNR